jgi:hypothetical protein
MPAAAVACSAVYVVIGMLVLALAAGYQLRGIRGVPGQPSGPAEHEHPEPLDEPSGPATPDRPDLRASPDKPRRSHDHAERRLSEVVPVYAAYDQDVCGVDMSLNNVQPVATQF